MKIRGVVDIEGIALNVIIDAPDDTKELYVTNISARCLVMPKERWPLRCLGLSQEVFRELTDKGFATLDHVVDAHWKIKDDLAVRPNTKKELEKQVVYFLDRALIFPDLSVPEENKDKITFPISGEWERVSESHESPAHATIPDPLLGQRSLMEFGLPAHIAKKLQVDHGIDTIDDLLRLGKVRVFMTKGLSKKDVALIDEHLKVHGLSYYDPLKKEEDVDSETK